MKTCISIVRAPAMILLVSLLATGASETYAAQNGDQASTDIVEAARAKLTGGGTFAEKVVHAQAKSEEVQEIARERAATFASAVAGKSAAQLRARLPGNAQVAKAEGSPCDDPPVSPPLDGAALCKPGEH